MYVYSDEIIDISTYEPIINQQYIYIVVWDVLTNLEISKIPAISLWK